MYSSTRTSPLENQERLESCVTHPDYFLHILPSIAGTSSHLTSNDNDHDNTKKSTSSTSSTDTYIIFFIPGNPGLISYYRTFLSLLSSSLSSTATGIEAAAFLECIVAGFSLGGFEVDDDLASSSAPLMTGSVGTADTTAVVGGGDGDGGGGGGTGGIGERGSSFSALPSRGEWPKGPLYSLQEQIELSAFRLEALVERVMADMGTTPSSRCKVVLVGHSVGAYIALEILRRHKTRRRQQRRHQQQSPEKNPFSSKEKMPGLDQTTHTTSNVPIDFDITAALLLTPTIVDIALSSSGRLLTPVLKYIPAFPLMTSWAARTLGTLLPHSWLETLVRIVMSGGNDRGTPLDAVRSTVSFLKSKNGVRQSLGMAADEMREIGPDEWGREVWGVADADTDADSEAEEEHEQRTRTRTRLVLYFARHDHWVADRTRDAIIRTRGGGWEGGVRTAKIIVAEDTDLVHGWCIRHSRPVAEKVDIWVRDVIKDGIEQTERPSESGK